MPSLDHGGELLQELDAELLRHSLHCLDICASLDALATAEEHAARTASAAQATVLPPSYNQMTATFDESCILREYGAEACDTLVISFGGLVQGMGVITHHEFVGVCRRVGAQPSTSFLFVKGAALRAFLAAAPLRR